LATTGSGYCSLPTADGPTRDGHLSPAGTMLSDEEPVSWPPLGGAPALVGRPELGQSTLCSELPLCPAMALTNRPRP